MTQVEEIVAGLSEAERKAVMFIGSAVRPYGGVPIFATYWDRPENKGLLKVIRDEHKLTFCDNKIEKGPCPIERLTPLGIQVRDALKGQP